MWIPHLSYAYIKSQAATHVIASMSYLQHYADHSKNTP